MIPIWLDEVGSTMDEARERAARGAPHGLAVAAHVQTAGRGRGGRAWASPRGNLHTTVVLRPCLPPRRGAELGFVMALAVAAAIDDLAGPGTALKWPNDVLRGGAKLAGVLLERLADGAVLAGIGLNVQRVPGDVPYPVISLAALGCTATAETVLDAILTHLAQEWEAWRASGFANVLVRWALRGPTLGAPLRVRLPDGLLAGRFAGLGPDGALLLDTGSGRRTLMAGDVML